MLTDWTYDAMFQRPANAKDYRKAVHAGLSV